MSEHDELLRELRGSVGRLASIRHQMEEKEFLLEHELELDTDMKVIDMDEVKRMIEESEERMAQRISDLVKVCMSLKQEVVSQKKEIESLRSRLPSS